MSHVTEVKMKIADLDALKEACHELGLEFMEGQKTHKWYGRFVGDTTPPQGRDPKDYGKCEHAIRLQNARSSDYEIGLVPALDGNGYDLMVDSWQQGRLMGAVGGHDMGKLRQEYAAAVALAKAKKTLGPRGWQYAGRTALSNGKVQLRWRHR